MRLLAELGQEIYRCNDCVKWLPTWQDLQLYPDLGGYSHEGHNVVTKISRKQREITAGRVTFECLRCGEDATFVAVSDLTKNGVLVCTKIDGWSQKGWYIPAHKHTIKEVSE